MDLKSNTQINFMTFLTLTCLDCPEQAYLKQCDEL